MACSLGQVLTSRSFRGAMKALLSDNLREILADKNKAKQLKEAISVLVGKDSVSVVIGNKLYEVKFLRHV